MAEKSIWFWYKIFKKF